MTTDRSTKSQLQSPLMPCRWVLLSIGARVVALAVLVASTLPSWAEDAPTAQAPEWKVGVASAKITPEQRLHMAGYASRKEPAEGTVQDLFGKAIAIEDLAGNRVVFVTLDLIGVMEELRSEVATRVQEKYQLPPHALLMNASHTHCGPAYGAEDAKDYFDSLATTLVEIVGQSLAQLQPADLSYSFASCSVAMNRRTPTDEGFLNHPNPNGPVDHTVPVLSVRNPDDGKLRAVVFGYACHNTTMGFLQWQGDYAGYAQEYLEKDHPGVTALFMMGCGGDQNPYPRSELKYAQMHGRSLATAVEAALEVNQSKPRHQRPIHGSLSSALETVDLEFATPDRADFAYPVQVIRFGNDLTLVALGTEVVVDYALRLKRELTQSDGPAIWIAGYSNVSAGYIPSQRVLLEGGYEAESRPWKPTLEERIVGKVHELVERGPRDLPLTCHSDFDNADHPYRLVLPSAYDGKQAVPLLVALHGTGGNQNKYFDDPTYGDGIYKREAEKRGIAILCPSEGDPLGLPTEWRGVGELHVLTALEDVCRRFKVDRDRIVLTGQSMGGTGTTYLCCRYPDLFAAGIPLASTYGHLTLLENLRHVPMFYVQGADDWPIYAQDGPTRIVQRLEQLGYDARLWMVPDVGHNTMAISTPQVLDWALQQHLVKHPPRVTHHAYLPIHGRAYWTEISALDEIGPFAEIDAEVTSTSDILLHRLRNVKQFILRPDAQLLDSSQELHIRFAGETAGEAAAEPIAVHCDGDQQVRLDRSEDGIWKETIEPRKVRSYTSFRTHKVGHVAAIPSPDGEAETTLGSWTTDAIRDALGTDIAIATGRHYRGLPLTLEQDVYLFDLLNLLRPSNRVLVSFKIDGAGLLEILEDNIRQENSFDGQFLVQVSGCRYAFDRSRPAGERIVESDIDPERTYSVACVEGLLSRGDMLNLAGRFGTIEYEERELTNITAVWRYIDKRDGIINAQLDGRVRDVTKK